MSNPEHRPGQPRTTVLVEGVSDKAALEALAKRRGRDLDSEGVSVISIGGAHSIDRVLRELYPPDPGRRLAGMCDAREEPMFRRALERAGLGSNLTQDDLERLGFYVCHADLEDELIRAMGVEAVVRVIEELGEVPSFRSFQMQPAQRGRRAEAQLRRFMGTHSGRKALYARALVEAVPDAQMPPPLERLLAHIGAT